MADTRGIDRIQEGNETLVFSDNFGGLNTTASDVNTPYSDSPLLYNCDIDTSGNITKRKGTKIISNTLANNSVGFGWFNFISGLRYSYVVEKDGVDINIYEIDNSQVTILMSKTDVWDSLASSVIPSFARTSEFNPRTIICTGVNQPVQLTWVEQQQISDVAAASFVLTDAARFAYANFANTLVYVNRVRQTGFSVVYDGFTETLTLGVTVAIDDVVDVVLITWQHLTEALYLQGSDLTDRATRRHRDIIDANVQVPLGLSQDDIPSDFPTDPFSFGYAVYDSDRWDWDGSVGSQYTYINGQNPTLSDEWASGNGEVYVNALGGSVVPSPFFVTFGSFTGTGSDPPTEIFIAKRFDLNPYFNGGADIVSNRFIVKVDDVLALQNFSLVAGFASFGAYYLLDNTGTAITLAGLPIRYITFEASLRMGLNPESDVELVHNSLDYIGSGIVLPTLAGSTDNFRDGAGAPLYGAGESFDYLRGVFPRYVTTFDNRLVFSGFANNPLLIVFSELGDSTIPNFPYRKLQIRNADTLATDPVFLPLSSNADDYITGMRVWQDSIFVFTRHSVFRVYGNEVNGFNNTANFVDLISNQGCVNDRSIGRTDDSILYLSDTGVQVILFANADSENFRTAEVSINIRPEFGVTRNPLYETQSFIVYDPNRRKVYLGLPIENESINYSKRLLVFDVFRESWTEYKTDGDFKLWGMLSFQDQSLGDRMLGFYSGWNLTDRKLFLRFDDETYLDFRIDTVGTGANLDIVLPLYNHEVSFTLVDEVWSYFIDDAPNEDNHFDLIPNNDIADIYVTLEGTPLVFGTDYVKHYSQNGIELLFMPIPGQTLVVSKRSPVTDFIVTRNAYDLDNPIADHRPFHVVSDNRYLIQDTDYTVNSGINNPVTINLDTVANAAIYAGQYYEARYTSPLLVLGNLAVLKRGKHVYVYFNNELGREQFRQSDLNTLTSQEPDAIVGKPKQRLNANVELIYESSDRSDVGADVYSFYSLVYDDHLFDFDQSNSTYRENTLFKESLLGVGYSYKLSTWSFDEATFTLSAWQITSRIGRERFISHAL